MRETALPQALDVIAVAAAGAAETDTEALECFIETTLELAVRAWSTGDWRTAALATLLLLGATQLDQSTKLERQQRFFAELMLL